MSVVRITDYVEENGVIMYVINVSLPLRLIVVRRRFSQFVSLLQALCDEIGISTSDFPYRLPNKRGMLSNKMRLAASRIGSLETFLNSVARDKELQNRSALHDFLELPRNFKLSAALPQDSKRGAESGSFNFRSTIDSSPEWLSYFRLLRGRVADLQKKTDLASKAASRREVQERVIPDLAWLESSLAHLLKCGQISTAEHSLRLTKVQETKSEAQRILEDKIALWKTNNTQGLSRCEPDPPKETNDTVALSNKELLEKQQQVHQQQDQDLELLRQIIVNQRRIGEAIHKEVTEQNEILDALSAEVEASSGKLEKARSRTRKIT